MSEIKFNGTENDVIAILNSLSDFGYKASAVRKIGNALVIPTPSGAKQVYLNDTVIFDKEKNEIRVEEK